LLAAGLAAAHGGRATNPPTISGPQVFRTGGGVPPSPGTSGPKTRRGWETWWSFNREFELGSRMRTPVSGSARRNAPIKRLDRAKLREALYDLMLRALGDKNHLVRSSAAVALGKWGFTKANSALERHTYKRGEGWFDVREGALFAMGLLRFEDNLGTFRTIAGDKERPTRERGMVMVSLGLLNTQPGADLVKWHLKYYKSGIGSPSWRHPTRAEEERRRVAAHMLGFMSKADAADDLLYRVVLGARKWGDACRGLAVTALGRRRARDYADRLFRQLYQRDNPDAVKRSVPIALGLMLKQGDKDNVRRLGRVIRDFRRDRLVQHFAAMALADIGGDQAVEILSGLVRDNVINDDVDRAWLYLALGRLGRSSEPARQLLLARYRDARTQEIRSALALACGLGGVKDALPITLSHLKTAPGPSDATKKRPKKGGGKRKKRGGGAAPPRGSDRKQPANFLTWGLLAAGLHGDEKALDLVRTRYRRVSHPAVRHNGAIAIALILRERAVGELLGIMKETGNQHTKAGAIVALGLMPHPTQELVDGLKAMYSRDSNPDHVRALAIIALGNLAAPSSVPLSASLTNRYNYHIRTHALDELALYQ
jgi:HEAT repeat protein